MLRNRPADSLEAENHTSSFNGLLDKYGYRNSLSKGKPVSAVGSALPWYTYPAIEYLSQLNAKGLNIFEYGCGYSTIFWLSKGANVWAVDHDVSWFDYMNGQNINAQDLYFADSSLAYASTISKPEILFDLVIIDGAWRNECANSALSYLREGGMIVLDNSDWYTDVAAFLKNKNFFQVDFNGMGPINNYCWTTSIFIKTKTYLIERISSPKPIGGIEGIRSAEW